ncbi:MULTISPECIES: sn-glycerol-3-phosphate ABC transporter ATP-binding protein UgpC [unclassified Roseitalea]|uniref:ABC transporter ATP-binding protein n=1 Tax=unclassified Roseitalea TaxID=2639107 RepID=UPI00273D7EF8|nr:MULTISPECIES: sn-glycerol-3-phosphate ABC transporter ATP-binding protein UgpC [unclassified Roseitalea]
MAVVEINDVRKLYGNVEAIKGVSVDVPAGAFVVLVGPSGCGKSTLLRMIAGLEDISGGTISIGGHVINDVEPKHRDIAMVFQNYALYPHMTVEQNMGFSLRFAKRSKAEIRQRVQEAARILGLSDYLDRYPRQLSGGQRQRVAMGRAIVRQPRVYLFDEPLSNLDAKLRVQMRAELKDLHARLRTTTIYVTHDQIEAMTMADRIVVMRDGVIEQAGAPLDLYDRPANLFVAGFIGSPAMNLLEGENDPASGTVGFGGGASLSHAVAGTPQGPIVYGFRPEHVELVGEGEGPAATVTNVEPTGLDTLLVADMNGHAVAAYLRQRLTVKPGDTVHIRVAPEHVHLFDTATEARIVPD